MIPNLDLRVALHNLWQVKLGENCWHTCKIIGEGGAYWPNPTFQILAEDDGELIEAKSATGAWAGILSRIKTNILARYVHRFFCERNNSIVGKRSL